MAYALFALVLLMVAGFVWALLTSSVTVTYIALSCLSVAGIGYLIAVSAYKSRDS